MTRVEPVASPARKGFWGAKQPTAQDELADARREVEELREQLAQRDREPVIVSSVDDEPSRLAAERLRALEETERQLGMTVQHLQDVEEERDALKHRLESSMHASTSEPGVEDGSQPVAGSSGPKVEWLEQCCASLAEQLQQVQSENLELQEEIAVLRQEQPTQASDKSSPMAWHAEASSQQSDHNSHDMQHSSDSGSDAGTARGHSTAQERRLEGQLRKAQQLLGKSDARCRELEGDVQLLQKEGGAEAVEQAVAVAVAQRNGELASMQRRLFDLEAYVTSTGVDLHTVLGRAMSGRLSGAFPSTRSAGGIPDLPPLRGHRSGSLGTRSVGGRPLSTEREDFDMPGMGPPSVFAERHSEGTQSGALDELEGAAAMAAAAAEAAEAKEEILEMRNHLYQLEGALRDSESKRQQAVREKHMLEQQLQEVSGELTLAEQELTPGGRSQSYMQQSDSPRSSVQLSKVTDFPRNLHALAEAKGVELLALRRENEQLMKELVKNKLDLAELKAMVF